MRQYELAIRIAQVHHLVDERKYKKALAVIQTLDMRQVRSLSDLKVFAEVYTRTEQYEAAKATYLRIYRRSKTRRVLYRLIYLSIRTNALEDAEAYYQEFIRMNPSTRDALILRYRIDKAAGVPIGQLIEILQELKQEEYIEEWAYELAKLYHRAGRREECMEECQDILLWFGSGEIVERAKILIDHLQDKDPAPYYDDKDFTMPKKEEPNPEDTGSLPDLNEFIRERKEQKREERRAVREAKKQEDAYEEDEDEEEEEASKEDRELFDSTLSEDDLPEQVKEKKEAKEEPEFVDDYEEDDFDLPQKAKDGIQKLSGFLKFGKKEEDEKEPLEEKELLKGKKPSEPKKPSEGKKSSEGKKPSEGKKSLESKKEIASYPVHSQSGTGITQDLAKEISAIYEMEHREQLKEKAVTVINEVPNIATNVVDRMTHAIQKTAAKEYIPLDVEEIQGKETRMPQKEAEKPKDALTQALEKEVQEYKETKAKETTVEQEMPEPAEESTLEEVPEPELEPVKESTPEEEAEPEPVQESALEEEAEPEPVQESTSEKEEEPKPETTEENTSEEENMAQNDTTDIEQTSETELLKNLLEEEIQDPEEIAEEQEAEAEAAEDAVKTEEPEAEVTEDTVKTEEPEAEVTEDTVKTEEPEAEEPEDTVPEAENKAELTASVTSELEHYQAPEIPVVETDYMGMPEITYEDLPTTRALQQSFQNVLKLIAGELDPSHFVLMGDGSERIVGVSKQIVRVMKDTGYLTQGRIAKIHASQLNKMDLISFRDQLKGNCLLIEEASDLLFPTITKIFSIMEEYYGDFVVILADEGTTLDQLFRFVPALARKFKYIIDISKYTREDYE